MRRYLASFAIAVAILSAVVPPTAARAQEPFPEPPREMDGEERKGDRLSIDSDLVTGAIMTEKDMLQYCVNISDTAREVRYSIIQQKLDETQAQIDEKLVSLTEKLNAIKEFVEVRRQFQAAAEAQVVGIYEAMRPDAAASQLSELDTGMAAAIIMKLDPKTSSNILTEMKPKDAASIALYMSAAMRQADDQRAPQ